MKAPLRYLGSKWRLADWIVGHLPPHECYVEPFGGSAAVLLTKPRSRVEVYNDIDLEVVAFFEALREHADAIIEAVSLTPCSRAEHEVALGHDTPCDSVERARRFLIKSWQTRGGLRSNASGRTWWYSRGKGNANTAATTWRRLPRRLRDVADRLLDVHIECDDWRTILDRYDAPETCFYLDPPYLISTRNGGSRYVHEMHTEDEHREFLGRVLELEGHVLLSGYPSELYDEALAGWTCRRRDSLTQGASYRTECLWLSPGVPALQGRLAL